MVTITLKVSIKKYSEIKKYYKPYLVDKKGNNIDFVAKKGKAIITGYKSEKSTIKSIVISGLGSEKEAKFWKGDDVVIKIGKDDGHTPKEEKNDANSNKKPTEKPTKKVLKKKETKPTTKAEKPTKATTTKATTKASTKTTTKKEDKPKAKAPVKVVKTKKEENNKPTKTEKKISTPTTEKAPKTVLRWVDYNDQIGSDEVGVGDFLGPMIVVATYVKKEDIKFLTDLGVKDSKKLTDKKIMEIAPKLIARLEVSRLTLSNDKYNIMYMQNENLNSLKAKMHNRALLNLVDKHPEVVGVYVDQFVSKEKFYEYLDDPEERKVRDISFRTKGESLFPSVAASSIIARYAFLQEMQTLNEKYDVQIPLGASSKVNDFAREFIEKFGIAEFNKIAKRNFKNYKEVIKG